MWLLMVNSLSVKSVKSVVQFLWLRVRRAVLIVQIIPSPRKTTSISIRDASVMDGRARTPCAPRRAAECPPYLFSAVSVALRDKNNFLLILSR